MVVLNENIYSLSAEVTLGFTCKLNRVVAYIVSQLWRNRSAKREEALTPVLGYGRSFYKLVISKHWTPLVGGPVRGQFKVPVHVGSVARPEALPKATKFALKFKRLKQGTLNDRKTGST